MSELNQIRHGRLIKSVRNDQLGAEAHFVQELSKSSPQSLLKAVKKGNDREFSVQLKKHEAGGTLVEWETVAEVSTLAQALKVAKTRMMLSELSSEERQEIMRAIYPLVSEEPEEAETTDDE